MEIECCSIPQEQRRDKVRRLNKNTLIIFLINSYLFLPGFYIVNNQSTVESICKPNRSPKVPKSR